MTVARSFEPTSLSTTKSCASRLMCSSLASCGSVMVPSETSTCWRPRSVTQRRHSSSLCCDWQTSQKVPPSTTGTPASR